MAEVDVKKIANWKGTWIANAVTIMEGLFTASKNLENQAKGIKSDIKIIMKEADVEYAFFGESKGFRSYTTKPSVKKYVDTAELAKCEPDLFKRCHVNMFSEDKFNELADEKAKKQFIKEEVTRKGAKRFDTVEKVNVLVENRKVTFDGSTKDFAKDIPTSKVV